MEAKIGTALVVGAGIGGIRSALDLAECGYRVMLIDRAPHIGGVLSQLDVQFPSEGCGMCRMLPMLDRDSSSQFCLRKGLFHDNIRIHTSTTLSGLKAEGGRFNVRLHQNHTGIDPNLCVGCGACEMVCPVDIADSFNAGWGIRKAIYLPVPHAIPNAYVIDPTACTRCGACETVCPTAAVRLPGDQRSKFAILIVDDEPAMGDSLKEWLLNEGFSSVAVAHSGPAALEMLDAAPCQLMLTDIKMPGMDGVELLQKAKALRPDLTVVMMTAYATVETAVEAMKLGALDYFMKPFDPDAVIPFINRLQAAQEAAEDQEITFDTVIISTGTDPADPREKVNPYGYQQIPNVITNLELERLISGSGPWAGNLRRPSDGQPVRRIAWLQCVGSRNIQLNADYCATVCCMISVKQAGLVLERSPHPIQATIFYMDLRSFGKAFQSYVDQAKSREGLRFARARVHSITLDPDSGDPVLQTVELDGRIQQEKYDLVVLAVGQRPTEGTRRMAQLLDLPTNPWGFFQAEPFAPARSSQPGLFFSGTACGPKPIGDTVLHASAAAMEAATTIRANGGSLALIEASPICDETLWQSPPRAIAAICRCGGRLTQCTSEQMLTTHLRRDPSLSQVVYCDALCTATGWQALEQQIDELSPNRILIGACHPYVFVPKLKELARRAALPVNLMEVVDLGICALNLDQSVPAAEAIMAHLSAKMSTELAMTLARLKHADPVRLPGLPVTQKALVVGGGIAGMSAALAMADMGYPVDLVEKSNRLGGNLNWIHATLEGNAIDPLLKSTVDRVENHPNIAVHLQTTVVDSSGTAGRFTSRVQNQDGERQSIYHGVGILATGGREAPTELYGYGTHDRIVTQQQMEERLNANDPTLNQPTCLVMIQCVGSREAPRNYCSRVCCSVTLKQALRLKTLQPETNIFVFYRDMMSYGFSETYFTQARQAGVIFIPYEVQHKPQVLATDGRLQVSARDPVSNLAVEIDPDWVVLATGIEPCLPAELATVFGVGRDAYGFFQEADAKWRPVDALKEGLFACGLVLAPHTIAEAVATGQAAAQRALRVLSRGMLPSAAITATVRASLCVRCGRCIETCPFEARSLDEEDQAVRVDPAMCQGCGACAAICPNGAAIVSNCSKPQILETIDAALAG